MPHDENMETATVEEAPTIQSIIPAKHMEMDVDPLQSTEDLSESHRNLIHATIGEILTDKPHGHLQDLHDSLRQKGLTVTPDCLTGYLHWIVQNYETQPQLHLPQILFDQDSQEFFDVS